MELNALNTCETRDYLDSTIRISQLHIELFYRSIFELSKKNKIETFNLKESALIFLLEIHSNREHPGESITQKNFLILTSLKLGKITISVLFVYTSMPKMQKK